MYCNLINSNNQSLGKCISLLRLLHLVHQNIKLLFFYEFYIHKISILFKSYFYGNFKFCFFFYFTKSTKKKYYAVDVRNSCNTTCSVSFCLAEKKKKNIFSNFSIFAFFCSNIFFFYIFWCMENYKSILLLSLPLFTSLTFVSFYPLTSAQVYGLYKNKENLHVIVF